MSRGTGFSTGQLIAINHSRISDSIASSSVATAVFDAISPPTSSTAVNTGNSQRGHPCSRSRIGADHRCNADVRLTRPADGPLVLLLATRSMPGVTTIEAAGPGGPVREDVYLGSVVALPLGDGKAGEPAQVSLSVIDAHDSIEGFLGLRSFAVLRADDLQAQVIAHRSAAEALRQELDFMSNTRSWKVTAPLRKWKGRGA